MVVTKCNSPTNNPYLAANMVVLFERLNSR